MILIVMDLVGMTSSAAGKFVAAVIAVVAGLSLTACADSETNSSGGTLDVVVGFYPQQYLAEMIGGRKVEVSNLAQPGAEPHDMELTPRQIGEVAAADLVLYEKGLQPSLDGAVEENAADTSLDLATVTTLKDGYQKLGEEEHAGVDGDRSHKDPHIWLDPTLMAKMADSVAKRLSKIDPDSASYFTKNVRALDTKLQALDQSYKAGLTTCARTTIVTTHNAFGYLADRYGLTQLGIVGLTPDVEPSPKKLAEVAAYAKKNGVTTIFYEETVSPKFAQTIADEVGAKTAVLSPIEVAGDGKDYLSTMNSNLVALRAALGCT